MASGFAPALGHAPAAHGQDQITNHNLIYRGSFSVLFDLFPQLAGDLDMAEVDGGMLESMQ
jgi:hypothetical protein